MPFINETPTPAPIHTHAHRYRVECKRWVHVNATPDAQGMGKCVQYQEEMEAADRLYEERHSLDRKKEQVRVSGWLRVKGEGWLWVCAQGEHTMRLYFFLLSDILLCVKLFLGAFLLFSLFCALSFFKLLRYESSPSTIV